MNKLSVFNFTTLNGFYKGLREDISWHKHAKEENDFSADSLTHGNTLLFGRVTYEMMANYWPTPMALENNPVVAKGMNESDKIVFSNTLKKATWNNTRLIKGDIVAEVRKLKQSNGKDMTLLGSGNVLTQLAAANLIDEYLIMVDPVAIGEGVSIFHGISHQLDLKLFSTRVFEKTGVVLLSYKPA